MIFIKAEPPGGSPTVWETARQAQSVADAIDAGIWIEFNGSSLILRPGGLVEDAVTDWIRQQGGDATGHSGPATYVSDESLLATRERVRSDTIHPSAVDRPFPLSHRKVIEIIDELLERRRLLAQMAARAASVTEGT